MTKHIHLLCLLSFASLGTQVAMGVDAQDNRPNIVVVLIDDMGYGDMGCYGRDDAATPNLDRLAEQGLRLTQFYVNAPICSPSRVALTTGQYPARLRVSGHFDDRRSNRAREMVDFLDPTVPTLARTLQAQGYATAHFGKWHMGGGRDVDDAPLPQAYGFDESLVSFEGLGNRILILNDALSQRSAELEQGEVRYVHKHEMTGIYVDHAISFIEQHADEPFYIRVFPNDVHDPFDPAEADLARHADRSDNIYMQQYDAVVEAMDRELGRLFSYLDTAGLADNTIVVVASDNGPTAWAWYYDQGLPPPGLTGGLRGRKWSLYEGGIREPLIIRWPGHVPAAEIDEQTVMVAMDLYPTLVAMAGMSMPADADIDGLDRRAAMMGQPIADRGAPIFWEYGRNRRFIQPGLEIDQSPTLAVRDGDLKLLMDPDGSRLQLYNLAEDRAETTNLAEQLPQQASRLRRMLEAWWAAMPQGWEKP